MTRPLKDIYWMSSPLCIKEREAISQDYGKYLSPRARKFLDPKTKYSPFRATGYKLFNKIKHWTLEVDGWCYELLPVGWQKLKVVRLGSDACKPESNPADRWHEFRREHGIEPERRKVGQTRMTHEEIKAGVDQIWEKFNHGLYVLLVQNCQNFAKMVHEFIAVDPNDAQVSESEKKDWKPMPDPVSYQLADFSRGSLASGGSVGVAHIYLAALAPAAEVVEVGGAVTAATAGGATVAGEGTVGTVGTATTTTAQTTTATATHGTAATAGKAGLLKGTATTGSTTASKFGVVGAKLSSTGLAQGAGAAKLGTAAKVGAAVAMAHPVTGCVVLGLGLLALSSKRDKGWVKKNKEELENLDVSVLDVLEAEQKLLDEKDGLNQSASASGDGVEVVGVDGRRVGGGGRRRVTADDDDDELKLTLVTTEPADMWSEKTNPKSNGVVGVEEIHQTSTETVEHARRSQTLA